ncbi:MAG TPA: DUF2971 domain-containing protein [Saprospiraceae bacterium]|nr:DUF2971 domain-containing protein [Saprospiraceae bacterium]
MDDLIPEFNKFIESEDALFHYTSMQKALEYILPNQILRLSPPSNTDDPQEYNSWLIGLLGWSLPEDILEVWSETATKFNQRIKKNTFLSCFCSNLIQDPGEDSPKPENALGYKKSRMWSQYGDHHRGVCLAFSRQSLIQLVEESGKQSWCSPVEYKQNGMDPNALIFNGNDLVNKGVEQSIDEHLSRHSSSIFFTKDIDYCNESEYRIVICEADANEGYFDLGISDALKGIILGDRFNEVYIPSVTSVSHGYPIRKLKWNKGDYLPVPLSHKVKSI